MYWFSEVCVLAACCAANWEGVSSPAGATAEVGEVDTFPKLRIGYLVDGWAAVGGGPVGFAGGSGIKASP